MMQAVLIDDESKNNIILEKMLIQFCPQVTVVGKAEDSRSGLEIIRELKPDLVFLDIEMPYGNAFDLLDRLKPVDFEVIFVTAFDNYALKAFRYNGLDYLLKPVDIEELITAVERAQARQKSSFSNVEQLELLVQRLQNPKLPLEKLALPAKEGYVFRNVNEILRCEAQRGYTAFFFQSGEKILSATGIKEYEELLPESTFFRIHNSHLINLNFIKKYHKGRGGVVEMSDGTMLEVATRRKDELLARFGRGTV